MMTKEERLTIARECAEVAAVARHEASFAQVLERAGYYAVREDDDGTLSAIGMELPAEASL